jgi:hypothetical protein
MGLDTIPLMGGRLDCWDWSVNSCAVNQLLVISSILDRPHQYVDATFDHVGWDRVCTRCWFLICLISNLDVSFIVIAGTSTCTSEDPREHRPGGTDPAVING